MAGQERGITIGFNADTADFDKNVDKLNKEIKALKKEVRLFNNELKFKPDSFSLLYTKIRNLTQQQEKAKKVLKEYQGYLEGLRANNQVGTEEWDATQNSIIKTNKEIRNITRQIDKANESMESLIEKFSPETFEDSVRRAAEGMVAFSEATEKISKASQKFLKDAATEAINFEDAFAEVRKTLEINGKSEADTEARYLAIADALRELSTTVPTTADELAKIAGLAGQMGVGEDYILAFTKAMVDFGNATNITASEAAQEIAQIYNVIGKGGDFSDLDQLLSTIVELGNNTATTERDIVEMFRNIASAASSVGMDESQMAALAATLSSLGLDKGGASAISNIMRQIDTAVDTNSAKLQDWADAAGMSIDTFKQAWGQDAAGALASLLENLKKTVDEGGNLNEEFADLNIKELRRIDTMGRLVNAQQLYADTLKMAADAYQEGNALSEEANKRYGTLQSKIQILKNKFDEFKRTIGDQLAPVLSQIVDFAGVLLDKINALPGGINTLITVLTSLMAVMSPLLGVAGKYLLNITNTKGKLTELITKFTGFKGILAGVFGALLVLYATNDEFRQSVNNTAVEIWEHLKPVLETLWDILKMLWEAGGNLIQKVNELWNLFKDSVAGKIFIGTLEAIVNMIKIVLDVIALLIERVKDLFGLFLRVLGLESDVAQGMPSTGSMSGRGSFSSGGFMSGGITLNNTFTINNGQNIDKSVVYEWVDMMTDRINENLGRMI